MESRTTQSDILTPIGVSEKMRRYPVHSSDRRQLESVPWAMLEEHAYQVESNHGQTLERLAERGGLGLTEIVAAVEGKRLRDVRGMSEDSALERVRELVFDWERRNSGPYSPGYAAAVADIREMLAELSSLCDPAEGSGAFDYVLDKIAHGKHVGLAKKNGA